MQTSKCRASNVERNRRLRQSVTSAFSFTSWNSYSLIKLRHETVKTYFATKRIWVRTLHHDSRRVSVGGSSCQRLLTGDGS
jgi:hypothetical protein